EWMCTLPGPAHHPVSGTRVLPPMGTWAPWRVVPDPDGHPPPVLPGRLLRRIGVVEHAYPPAGAAYEEHPGVNLHGMARRGTNVLGRRGFHNGRDRHVWGATGVGNPTEATPSRPRSKVAAHLGLVIRRLPRGPARGGRDRSLSRSTESRRGLHRNDDAPSEGFARS